MIRAIAAVAAVVTLFATHSTLAEKQNTSAEVRSYRRIREELPKRTPVPLRLPTFIPDTDEGTTLFAILESANTDGYKIQLAWTEDCMGGNACHLGEISGSQRPLAPEGRRIPVVLRKAIHGFFIDATCGAHCDDSVIYWTENGYQYSIAMKAEKKTTLMKMANSAIGEIPKP